MKSQLKQWVKGGLHWSADTFGAHRRSAVNNPGLWVLMYHRVLPQHDPRFITEEPGMVVTPESFRMHMEEAQKLFSMVGLNDWVRHCQQGDRLPEKACAVTFDDGWLDNYEFAKPILEEMGIPATVFVVSNRIGTGFRFWPNLIAEWVHQQDERLSNVALLAPAAELLGKPFDREAVSSAIHQLKVHSEAEIYQALATAGWKESEGKDNRLLMNWEEVNRLAASNLFDVECHTANHLRLNKGLSTESLTHEIVTSASEVEQEVRKPVRAFCFPNGDYDEAALALVKQRYDWAVTTQRGVNRLDNLKLHELLRVPVHEDGTNTPLKFRAKLAGWGV